MNIALFQCGYRIHYPFLQGLVFDYMCMQNLDSINLIFMNVNQSANPLVPAQQKGEQSDTSYCVKIKSLPKAQGFYQLAKNRLLHVSDWDKLCGLVTATFTLMDNNGNTLDRHAMKGDFIRIDIPGPGTTAGHGFDWVRIEAIESTNTPPYKEEVAMRVRPAKYPKGNNVTTAHFFSNDATSTFSVIRKGNLIKASVNGRNELVNIKQSNIWDKIRNMFTAIGAMLGLSKSQWKKLVKGILSPA